MLGEVPLDLADDAVSVTVAISSGVERAQVIRLHLRKLKVLSLLINHKFQCLF